MNGGLDSRPLRLGWYQVTEGELEGLCPPEKGYALGILGPAATTALNEAEWIGAFTGINFYNKRYCALGITDPPWAGEPVEWGDGVSIGALVDTFTSVRDKLAAGLAGRDNDGIAFIDATAISKSVAAYLIGLLIRSRAVAGIDIFYQQMSYSYRGEKLQTVYADTYASREINDIEFLLSAIPYVEGKYRSSLRRHVIMLAGLDFQRTIGKIRELEPTSIDIIVETEALSELGSLQSFDDLCRRMDVDAGHVSTVSRHDLAGAVNALRAAILQASARDLQILVVSSGGKPFAIASALQSVLESEAPVLTTIPDRVVPLEQEPTGPSYLYRLRDQTAIT